VQNQVILELEDMLFREAQVGGAIDPEQVGLGITLSGKIPISKIDEAISLADGEDDHILTTPTVEVDPGVGGLVVLGTPVFSTLV